jgi:hypothetical protein
LLIQVYILFFPVAQDIVAAIGYLILLLLLANGSYSSVLGAVGAAQEYVIVIAKRTGLRAQRRTRM